MSSQPYAPSRVRALAISDTGFVFDPRTGYSYTVNTTGLLLLTAMKEGLSVEGLAARLRTEFETEDAPVEDDVEGFLGLLREYGLAESGPIDTDGRGHS